MLVSVLAAGLGRLSVWMGHPESVTDGLEAVMDCHAAALRLPDPHWALGNAISR